MTHDAVPVCQWWKTEDIGPIVIAHCCRDWPVATLAPIGRCGLCGERPTLKENP